MGCGIEEEEANSMGGKCYWLISFMLEIISLFSTHTMIGNGIMDAKKKGSNFALDDVTVTTIMIWNWNWNITF